MTVVSPRRVRATSPLVEPEPEPASDQRRMMAFEFAKFANQHSTDYIRMADYKAAILVTLLSGNLLVLVQRGGAFIGQGYTGWRLALVVAACVYAVVTLAVAINTLRPRVFRNAAHGHLFWEDIQAHDKATYGKSLEHLSIETMMYELGEHNHNLSRSAVRKYRWLRTGYFMGLTSIALSAAVILWTSH